MEQLYAPWRSSYVKSTRSGDKDGNKITDECVFCTMVSQTRDVENLLLKRFEYTFALLSRFPYNAGHILILPYNHIGNLEDLSKETTEELMLATKASVPILKKVLQAGGVNLGMNVGKVAGASIPGHLHMHILPRWYGDTSFLPLIGEVKPISCDLNKTYVDLKPEFDLLSL